MSELETVVKMVDEVVKPLLAIQKSLDKTHQGFHKTQADIVNLTYQLTALYECFDKNNKMIAERSADLETLGEHFDASFTELKGIQKKIDKSIQDGVRGAAGDLTEAVKSQLKPYLASEIGAEIKYLHQAVQNAHTKLNDYESMTLGMHLKIVVIAMLCGIAMGSVTFFSMSYKIKHLFCDCQCSAPVCPDLPAEPPPASLKPQESIKKAQPTKPLSRQRYR